MGSGGGGADILFRAEVDATGAITALRLLEDQSGRLPAATNKVREGFDGLGSSAAGLFGQLQQLNKIMEATAATAGVYKFAEWIAGTVQLGVAADATSAKLAAMVQATGGSAGQSVAQLQSLATSLSQLTGASVESAKGAEALLLSFRSVGSQGFEPTMKTAADLAALMGTDLTSAVWMLGKALEDPVLGMTNLRRAGIVLSDAEKQQIKDLQASGDMLGAQAALLKDVEDRTRGLADAMGSTLQGSLNKVTNSWALLRAEEGQYWVAVLGGTDFLKNLATVLGMDADAVKALRESGSGIEWGQGFLGIISGAGPMTGVISGLQQIAALVAIIAGAKAPEGYTVTVPAKAPTLFSGITSDDLDAAAKAVESFQAMLNAANPLIAAMSTYKTTLSDLDDLETKVIVTEAERNTILGAAADKLKAALVANKAYADELKYESQTASLMTPDSFLDTVFQSEASSSTTFGGALATTFANEGSIAADSFLQNFSSGFGMHEAETFDPLALHAGQDFGHAMGDGIVGGIVSYGGGVAYKDAGSQAAKDFQRSFTSTLTAAFSGDFGKAWQDLWKGLAKDSADIVSTTLFGKAAGTDAQGNAIAAVPGIFSGNQSTQQTLEGAGALAGGYLSGAGYQHGNQGEAALGGAISGFVTGGMAGSMGGWNWVGAIVGAVVGGAMGYFASKGTPATDYNIYTGDQGSSVRYGGALGPDYVTQKQETEQLNDKVEQTEISLRDALKLMGQPFANPKDIFTFSGSSKDPSATFQTILSQLLPQDIFKAYTPALQTGLTGAGGLGVSDTRAAAELAAVANSGNFDTALSQFKAWITAIKDMGDIGKLLGASVDDLRAKVNQTLRDSFLAGFEDTMKKAKDLTDSLGQMFSSEQVSNAQQLYQVATDQYNAGLQYFSQLESLSKDLSQSYSDIFAGFDETSAKEKGTGYLASYYETQLNSLMDQLSTATSSEAVDRINQLIEKYGQALWNLQPSANQQIGALSRQDVQNMMQQAETESQAKIAGWEQEVADDNAKLKQQIDEMTAALTSATGVASNVSDDLGDLGDATGHLHDRFVQAADALDVFIARANAASTAIAGWS